MAFDNVLSPQRQARRRMSAQLVIDIHRREEAVGIDRPVVDTGDIGGVALASNTNSSCANIDVTGACCRIVSGTGTRRHVGGPVVIVEVVKSDGRFGVSEGVVQQRIPAAGRIQAAGVKKQRVNANSGIVVSSGVAKERAKTSGRIIAASGIILERTDATSCVLGADGVAAERGTADSRVARSFNVIKKGKGTVRRIVAPDGVAKERTNAGGRVA